MSVGILDAAVAEADKSGARFACRAGILVFFSLGVLGAGLAYRADMPHSQYANDLSRGSHDVTKKIVPLFERALRADASPVGYPDRSGIPDSKLPIADGGLSRPETPQPKKLEQRLADAVRARGYSLDTERAYWMWCRQFILHFDKRHPDEMGDAEVQEFLSHLAVDRELGASSQRGVTAV